MLYVVLYVLYVECCITHLFTSFHFIILPPQTIQRRVNEETHISLNVWKRFLMFFRGFTRPHAAMKVTVSYFRSGSMYECVYVYVYVCVCVCVCVCMGAGSGRTQQMVVE